MQILLGHWGIQARSKFEKTHFRLLKTLDRRRSLLGVAQMKNSRPKPCEHVRGEVSCVEWSIGI